MSEELREVSKTTKYLKVQYTNDELLQIGRDLAAKHNEAAQLELDRKDTADSFKARISKVAAEVSAMSHEVSAGYHFENVACQVIKNFETGICTTVRNDTGEIVEERRLTDSELQMGLKIEAETEPEAIAAEPEDKGGE